MYTRVGIEKGDFRAVGLKHPAEGAFAGGDASGDKQGGAGWHGVGRHFGDFAGAERPWGTWRGGCFLASVSMRGREDGRSFADFPDVINEKGVEILLSTPCEAINLPLWATSWD